MYLGAEDSEIFLIRYYKTKKSELEALKAQVVASFTAPESAPRWSNEYMEALDKEIAELEEARNARLKPCATSVGGVHEGACPYYAHEKLLMRLFIE